MNNSKSTRVYPKYRRLLAAVAVLLAVSIPLGAEQLPALWSVSDDDSTVYLFGTIHLMTEEVNWFEGKIKDAFETSDTLVVELDQSSIPREKQVQIIRELALLPQSASLGDIISDEHMSRLEEILKPAGVPMNAVQRWRPWYAAITVTAIVARQAGFMPQYGVDVTLLQKARSSDIEVRELESFRQQLKIFADLDREEAAYLLTDSIEQQEEIRKQFVKLKKHWLNQNLVPLEDLLLESEKENPDVYRTVFVQRNRQWMPEIEKLLQDAGTHFLAVGSGHLIGDQGLIELLKQRGYDVKRE
jgi:hypothetical protein